MNRVIRNWDLNAIYMIGPGHGGPGRGGQRLPRGHLQRGLSRTSPRTRTGCARSSASSPSPAASPRHVAPETPGSIHEGGELGYALSHAYGAAFDNPDLLVACIIGDGEAETGPLATGWHSNKFLDPVTDGAVLPILHLNGYKIANPTVLARIPEAELTSLLEGYGHKVVLGRGRRSREDAPADGGDARHGDRRDHSHPEARARERRRHPARLADDRLQHAQGLDRAEVRRRAANRGDLAFAPGADRRGGDQPRPSRLLETWLQELPPRRALRRERNAGPRAGGPRPPRATGG